MVLCLFDSSTLPSGVPGRVCRGQLKPVRELEIQSRDSVEHVHMVSPVNLSTFPNEPQVSLFNLKVQAALPK